VIEQVEQVTLQELMSQFSVKRINFLKLDIEGAEYELLKDPDTWLQQCDVLMVELHERFCPGVESLYSKACQGRQEIHSVAEKRLSVSAGI
jgi:formylmethanofuran dehydrogenase subunit E-like metal-binding protein